MPSCVMMAAARTFPTPGNASSSSETFIRAIASSSIAELMMSAAELAPFLRFSLAAARVALAAAALFKASVRSDADKGRSTMVDTPGSGWIRPRAAALGHVLKLPFGAARINASGETGSYSPRSPSRVRWAASRNARGCGPAERISLLEVPSTCG